MKAISVLSACHRFCHDYRGVFALKLALIAPVLLLGVGVAIDYARMSIAVTEMQDAADSAALIAARSNMVSKQGNWEDAGQKAFAENIRYTRDLSMESVQVFKADDYTMQVTAEARLKAYFPQILGYPKYNLVRTSQATIQNSGRFELAIAIDTTNSMAATSAWETAVETLEDILEEIKDISGDNFYVTLVPFQNRVNIGPHRSGWLSGAAPSGWGGCVDPREEVDGSYQWAVDNDNPISEPFDPAVEKVGGGGPYDCNVKPIAGPTASPSVIANAAKNLSVSQSGRFDQGLAWAWRAVTPTWRGYWGIPDYPGLADETQKVVVFMTDGRSTVNKREMSEEEDWGWNNGSRVAFEHMQHVCDRMKADDVELYILRLPGNDHAEPYLRNCASSLDHYFEGDSANDLADFVGQVRDDLMSKMRIIN